MNGLIDRIHELVLPNGQMPDQMWIVGPVYPDELNMPSAWDIVAVGQTADFLRLVTGEVAQELGAAQLVNSVNSVNETVYLRVWRCQWRADCTNLATHAVDRPDSDDITWRCDGCAPAGTTHVADG